MFAIWRKSDAYYLSNITEGETEVLPDNQVIDRSRKKDQLENWGVGDGGVFDFRKDLWELLGTRNKLAISWPARRQ